MSVHYKFKSGKEAHTITFDSLHISVGELKKCIMQQRKIGKSAELDLQVTNAQTKEVYESDSILIPKNTSVIVARVPVAAAKKSWNKNDKSNDNNTFSTDENTKIIKSNNNNLTEGTEDDKIKEMLTQSTKDYDPSKYARGKGPQGPLPPNYTCYRCGKPGHYIKHCPTNNVDVKRSTGIPRSFMIPAKADQKGAMITAIGEYAVPIIDHDAYREVKKEKPPFFPTESEPEAPKMEIPDDLKCSLCNNLLQDAVLIPCCGNSFCDECNFGRFLDPSYSSLVSSSESLQESSLIKPKLLVLRFEPPILVT